ncbi:hypothetical protein AAZX31_06G135100 [Glycine max]|uniref:Uncharacterized protein n=2 Tax=Glycine subgen. Soja TaxID=1462606 RepID=I1KB66_SOYBN|nr:uncharacterized protein LOC100775497 [Glycine max]XP_028236284.1 uncharacterized protein LOC114415675 [Glycine soja]KAG5019318.1 hypothetical protein JHK87_015173 [Glycine soja]KAG5045870.1 hypothetical protein JHK86_015276 [Glycine max]KAH1125845.1 hypothetical protein GYH30_015068 [Glycine max]KAH1245693.1 hypothetical protein GmHk_06G015961 [Glycine max]KHN25798.1 hypothetical protein glysoja_038294 [Glycine soja]|eukprot:XP_003526794.1 uncharacterized protein LOC100775497 [Glycine max]
MKGSCCLANTHKLYSSLPLSNSNNNHIVSCQKGFTFKVRNLGFNVDKSFWSNHVSYVAQKRKGNGSFVVGCASWSLVRELEKELEAEMNTHEETGMAKFKHKCGEGKGVVEMLECLEREAIMGEDVGKEPMDYNRRAQIFDRSSRVFQALKELNNNNSQ